MEETRHAELNKKKWDSRAETWDDRRYYIFRVAQKILVSQLDLKENQTLLDLGCGTGWAVRYAASLVNERGEFYGIEHRGNTNCSEVISLPRRRLSFLSKRKTCEFNSIRTSRY